MIKVTAESPQLAVIRSNASRLFLINCWRRLVSASAALSDMFLSRSTDRFL